MFYLTKTPKWVGKLFTGSIWHMSETEKVLYLTFDDGPHPEITPFVLEQLDKFGAKATFFCIGKNVLENYNIYNRILHEGHAVGNHTFDHLDGWKVDKDEYVLNVKKAAEQISSRLFRPPYGRITMSQRKALTDGDYPLKIIMWSVLSGDFDENITPEQCCKYVLRDSQNGSVIVFHDSAKAFNRMKYALPLVLKHFTEKGYLFKKIQL